MKKTLETSAIAFAAVLALATPFASAHAACGVCPQCDPTDNDEKEATRTIDKVNKRIDKLEEKLVETLKLHAAQTTGAVEKVGPQVAAAIDGLVRSMKEMKQEEHLAQSIKEHMTSAAGCGNTSQATAFTEAEKGTKAAIQKIFKKGSARSGSTKWVPGGKAPVSKPGEPVGAQDDVVQRFDELQDTRNTEEDKNPEKTLFGNLTIGENTDVDRTGVTETNPPGAKIPKEQKAAILLRDNLINPIKQEPAPTALTDPSKADFSGKLAYNRLRSNEAREEMAKAPLNFSMGMRTPSVDTKYVSEILNNASFQMDPNDKNVENNKISQFYLMNIVMNQKFQDPKWHAELWKDGGENLQRQMAQMMAFSLMLQWKQFQMMEMLTAVMSTKLGMDLEVARGAGVQVEGLPTK
ncbi:MAG TPA: hypothetical protein DCW68_07710 [Rhodospirillaceae bacterium]|nr:MAG: hypothetical protein A2018_08070 [Alphaproteobacteria bacterium GWF2_58_20]HAU29973.1 hypothetical protein [Rhodospirillaceae bacterium]